ncbi:MAG: hypothetical protein ABI901_03435, partial [Roseiflexaceae bacterium]
IPSRADGEGPHNYKLRLLGRMEAIITVVRSLDALRQPANDVSLKSLKINMAYFLFLSIAVLEQKVYQDIALLLGVSY